MEAASALSGIFAQSVRSGWNANSSRAGRRARAEARTEKDAAREAAEGHAEQGGVVEERGPRDGGEEGDRVGERRERGGEEPGGGEGVVREVGGLEHPGVELEQVPRPRRRLEQRRQRLPRRHRSFGREREEKAHSAANARATLEFAAEACRAVLAVVNN